MVWKALDLGYRINTFVVVIFRFSTEKQKKIIVTLKKCSFRILTNIFDKNDTLWQKPREGLNPSRSKSYYEKMKNSIF